MIDDDATIVLSTESYNAGMAEVHIGNYEIAENSKIVLKEKNGAIAGSYEEPWIFFEVKRCGIAILLIFSFS